MSDSNDSFDESDPEEVSNSDPGSAASTSSEGEYNVFSYLPIRLLVFLLRFLLWANSIRSLFAFF